MIYECHRCGKLHNEDNGYMAEKSILGFGIMGSTMVFICKNCMSKKGKKILEKINNEKNR